MTFLNFYCGVFLVHVHILNVYHLAIVWFSIVQEELEHVMDFWVMCESLQPQKSMNTFWVHISFLPNCSRKDLIRFLKYALGVLSHTYFWKYPLGRCVPMDDMLWLGTFWWITIQFVGRMKLYVADFISYTDVPDIYTYISQTLVRALLYLQSYFLT